MARSDEAPRSREWNVQILVDVVIEKYGAEYFTIVAFCTKCRQSWNLSLTLSLVPSKIESK